MRFLDAVPADSATLRRYFGCFPSGVAAVCAFIGGAPVGMAASSFTSVSIDPPLLSVCIRQESETWRQLRNSPRLGISILAEEQDVTCRTLSDKYGDRFCGVAWDRSRDDAVFIRDAAACFDCSVHAEIPAGDHDIVLLAIHAAQADHGIEALVFHKGRFRKLLAAEGGYQN